MKTLIILLSFALFNLQAGAQTLFTYGPYKVSKDEFLRAFSKNNPDTGDYRKSVTEYLDLYTRFRLKVRAAYDARLDTLPNQRADALGFRQQIEPGFLTDTTVFSRLAAEAWERSRKEISLSHIYIPLRADFKENPLSKEPASRQDSLAALKKVREIQARLRAGESFDALALAYSADPDVQQQKGYLGYITVFTLPYALENAAYGLADQQVSDPVITRSGYHFLKKLGERPARGTVKVAQILVATEPGAGPSSRASARRLADSLFQALRQGSSFEQLALAFSNDKSSYANGGALPEFGVGQYSPVFEQQAFALGDTGSICPPFETDFGFHILKKLGGTPPEQDPAAGLARYRAMVMEDSRNQLAREQFERNAMITTGYRKASYRETELWNVTDSFLVTGKTIQSASIKPGSVLFSFPKGKATVAEWLDYAREHALVADQQTYPALMDAYARFRSVEYYRERLESFDPAFAAQMQEFKDGNLLFEVMERQVWSKAGTDTAGLRKHYEKNRGRYTWGPSADAVILHASDLQTASDALAALRKKPDAWPALVEQSGGRLIADSARFELSQLTDAAAATLREGSFTEIKANEADGSQTFTYIVKVYPKSAPRTFEESRGQVMSDYQQALEDQWVATLKKKYPVVLNKAEWEKVLARK
jgi:peptidyl-prolyl cis-trans isomerase SurA